MPMSAWHIDNPPSPGVYLTRTRGAWWGMWRQWTGLWWSTGYWTRSGCQRAVEDFAAEDAIMPRAEQRIVDWREVLE